MNRLRIKNKPLALATGCVFEVAFLWLLIGALRSGTATVLTKHPGFNNGAIEVGNVGAADMTQTILSSGETPLKYWSLVLFFAIMAAGIAWFIVAVARSRAR